MPGNNCQNCEYKRINNSPELHCYMWKTEPPDCGQYRPIDGPRPVTKVTAGSLAAAVLLAAAMGRTR